MVKSVFTSQLVLVQLESDLLKTKRTITSSTNKGVVLAAHRRKKQLLIGIACEEQWYMQSCSMASVLRVMRKGMPTAEHFLAPV